MCGSRNATPLGLKAARDCGHAVSTRGLAVVSGYAKGVATETHLAALEQGGTTVIVLAEGINQFRIKRNFATCYDQQRILVVSQFHPAQRWASYAAMARNQVIFGLGRALWSSRPADDRCAAANIPLGALSVGAQKGQLHLRGDQNAHVPRDRGSCAPLHVINKRWIINLIQFCHNGFRYRGYVMGEKCEIAMGRSADGYG